MLFTMLYDSLRQTLPYLLPSSCIACSDRSKNNSTIFSSSIILSPPLRLHLYTTVLAANTTSDAKFRNKIISHFYKHDVTNRNNVLLHFACSLKKTLFHCFIIYIEKGRLPVKSVLFIGQSMARWLYVTTNPFIMRICSYITLMFPVNCRDLFPAGIVGLLLNFSLLFQPEG